MQEGKILDIAHVSFLDMIKVMITMSGAANAKGTLIRNALNTADKIKSVNYNSFAEYLAGIENATKSRYLPDGAPGAGMGRGSPESHLWITRPTNSRRFSRPK